MADDGPLQLSLFDEQDLAEITCPDFPGERLICLPQPVRGRQSGPAPARSCWPPPRPTWARSPPRSPPGGSRTRTRSASGAGKVINKRKVAKHFILGHQRRPDLLAPRPGQHRHRGRHRRDLRHPHPRPRGNPRRGRRRRRLQGPGAASNATSGTIKADDLDLRPIWHRLEDRVRGPRADLHARLLPHLAPAPGLGAADLHRRAPARRAPTPSPRPAARHPPTPRPPARPDPASSPSAASAT